MTKPQRNPKSLAAHPKPYTTRGQDIVIVATALVIAVAFVIARIYG
ncbi:hypothetical protein [Bradyrhizobium sp.]